MISETQQIKNLNLWLTLIGGEKNKKLRQLMKKTEELRDEGVEIYPKQEDILKQIKLSHPKNIKVVILGQDPYHEPGQAMGLSFSVPEGIPFPASLSNIFKELKSDIGAEMPTSGDLTRWAEQGVLLLNTVLTVKAHNANSFKDFGWQEITSEIIKVCFRMPQPIFFLCWGKQAEGVVKSCCENKKIPENKEIFVSTHPSPLSANKTNTSIPAFIGSKPFSKTNEFLRKNKSKEINWELE